LNVVLRAKAEASAPRHAPVTCRESRDRWSPARIGRRLAPELANRLMSAGGPLEFVEALDVDRIETICKLRMRQSRRSAISATDYC